MTDVLVVGVGRMGQRHVRALRQIQDARVVATVDPDVGGIDGIPHFASVVDALRSVNVDAATVAAPTSHHATIAGELVAAGVPSLIEKPLAATASEAKEVLAAAEAAGVLVAAGHVERFNPAVRLVRELLASGRVGRPITMTFRRVGLSPPGVPDADVVHDLAVHDIDVFALLTGECPTLVGAAGWPAGGLAESAQVLIEAAGVSAAVQVNWRTPVRLRQFSVTTEERYLEIDYTTQTVDVIEPTDLKEFVEFEAFQSHYGSARRIRLECARAEPLAEELAAFVSAVSGGDAGPLAIGRDGLCAIDVADEVTRRWAAAGA